MIKVYLKYILLSALLLGGYIALYGFSVVMFYLFIGIFMLPIVVIGFPFVIFVLWKKVLIPVENKLVKTIILVVHYLIFAIITYQLDSYISWSEDGNLDIYLSWLGL